MAMINCAIKYYLNDVLHLRVFFFYFVRVSF